MWVRKGFVFTDSLKGACWRPCRVVLFASRSISSTAMPHAPRCIMRSLFSTLTGALQPGNNGRVSGATSNVLWVLPAGGHLDTPRAIMIKMVLHTGGLLLPGRWVLAVPGLPGSGGRRVPSDKMSYTESTSPQIHSLLLPKFMGSLMGFRASRKAT